MICPTCAHPDSLVVDTRPSRARANSIRRRHQCKACTARWTTAEVSVDVLSEMQARVEAAEERVTAVLAVALEEAMEGAAGQAADAYRKRADELAELVRTQAGGGMGGTRLPGKVRSLDARRGHERVADESW